MTFNLGIPSNWIKLLSNKLVVQYIKGDSSKKEYKYVPIPPIYITPNSNTLLIGVQSNSAKKHWYLGARISQYLYVSPSTSPNFIQGVETSDQKRVRLNNLTLVNFKDYGIYPYILAIEIPYWLEDAYVEAWEYNQVVNDPTQQLNIQEIKQRLDRIEHKIDDLLINPQQSSPPTNFSTGFDNPNSSSFPGII